MSSQEQSDSPKETINKEVFPLVIAEYNALREEILKRIEIEYQLISLALIAPGTIITIGFDLKNASVMFLYPILALFLSAIWLANSHGKLNIGNYIRTHIESNYGKDIMGWERFRISPKIKLFRLVGFFGFRAIFIVTQWLTILAGFSVTKFSILENILLAIAIISNVLTIITLGYFEIERMRSKNI